MNNVETKLEYINKKINRGFIAAIFSLVITAVLIFVLSSKIEAGILFFFFLIDFILVSIFAYGIYKKSRVAATVMLLYFSIPKLLFVIETGSINGAVVFLIFLYFYFQAMIGTYQYHALKSKFKKRKRNQSQSSAIFRPIELFIGLRYLRARRRNRFLSFISSLSIIGIALAVLSLITVISIMNGFQAELRDRLLGMASHVVVSKNITTSNGVFDHDLVNEKMREIQLPKGMAPFVESDVMVSHNNNISPANLRGVDLSKEDQVSTLSSSIVAGDIKLISGKEKVLAIGVELADQLDLFVGDTVSLIVPITKDNSASITPRVEPYKVVALFRANIHRYDSTMIITSMDKAKRFLQGTGYDVGERILLQNMDDAFLIKEKLQSQLADYTVRDWADMHASFFTAIKIEKISMFAILLLIITVAAFNIVSTMAMGVAEKQSDIAILKTIGASSSGILKIFLLQGTIIGILGTAIGSIGGIIVANNIASWIATLEDWFGAKIFNPEVFYVSEIPSVMLWSDVSLVTGFSFLISVMATIYPAIRASSTNPALALRYE